MTRFIRAAGLRWPVEEDIEFAKDGLGLHQSQVRLHHAIAWRTSGWTRIHQARARWFHHRARLARDQALTLKPLACRPMAAAVLGAGPISVNAARDELCGLWIMRTMQ
jgi:hypothetical protein